MEYSTSLAPVSVLLDSGRGAGGIPLTQKIVGTLYDNFPAFLTHLCTGGGRGVRGEHTAPAA